MALEKAGINLTLQGEAQYIAGLRNINREMDLMATNTKLAVAQLGQGASPTQKFNTQMRHLGAEIEKASTKTMILRNRNKELPNQIFKTGKSLDGLKDKYEEQQSVLQKLGKTRDELTHYERYHTEEGIKATKAYNDQKQVVDELDAEIKKLEGSYNSMLEEYERMPNSMAEAQLATQKLLNEQEKLRDEYLKGGGVFTSFADKLESSGEKLQKYGRTVSDIGDSFMGVTVGILTGGGGALKAFMDWESALRGAMKTNDEVVDSNGNIVYSYQDLEDGLRELSKEIPVTNTELAEMAEIAGRLQVPTDEVVEFTEVVAKLGETTNLTSEEAAEQLGKFINITGAGTDTTLNLANALVELGNNTASSERETLRMSTRWASTGKIIGMTDDQILGLSASVISLGIRTEAGGSAVQRAFLKINDAVLEGGDSLASFAEVAGMSASDFKAAWQDDAAQALIPFLKGLDETHKAGGNVNEILRDLGVTSVNELNTLLVLAGGYDQLAGNLELASGAYHETEEAMMALNQEAELAYGTTLGKLRTAWNRLKDSLIDIGEPIADAVLDMVDAAEPLFETIENIATGFSEMDASAQRDIISTVGTIALIAPALKIAGGAMTTLGDIFDLSSKGIRKAGEIITRGMLDTTDGTVMLAGAAKTASGSSGVGGLITALTGSAGLPWALGIAAAALGGWTLWKTWGEDAHEASKRTKQWGSDVGEETSGILTKIGEVEGTFGLMAEGISVDTDSMVGDFASIGKSIENDINARLTATEEYLSGLPEVLRDSQEEILANQEERLKESLGIVTENTDKIKAIQKAASDENRDNTREEMNYIRELQKETLGEYISTLNLTAEEEKSIRQALSGDITDLSKKQSENVISAFAKQSQELKISKQNTINELNEMYEQGLIGEKEFNEMTADVERYFDAVSVSGERTMDELIAMYPELVETVNLATGEMIHSSMPYYDEIVEANKNMVENWTKSNRDMRKVASETGELSSYIVDSTAQKYKVWNDIVVSSGGSFDVFKEKLIEATKDTKTWNDIRLRVHDAELDSNAKLIIGEAAIANGWWDGMAWEDKQAILKDNFSETVYKAIVDEGTWDKLSWEEQTAVLNNEFSDGVAQAIMDEGKWRDLPWEEKKAILTTNSPKTLKQILKDIDVWNTLPIKVRKLLADGSQVNRAVDNAQRKINSLRGKSVTLETRKRTVYETVRRAGNSASSQRFAQSGGQILHARGTNFHPGGMAMVNDQSGATFRELVTLPDGSSFVPKGRNVLLDLPKGSKVLRAALTKMKFPDIKQYKEGVGYSRNEIRNIKQSNQPVVHNSKPVEINVYQTINSPKELDARESQRLARNNMQQLAYQLGGV